MTRTLPLVALLAACSNAPHHNDSTALVDTGAVRGTPQAVVAPPPPSPATAPALSDANILALMSMSNKDEIAAATAAEPRVTQPDVKAFAHLLAADHERLETLLDSVAGARRITPAPPAGADTLLHRMQHVRDSVAHILGAAFQRAFIETQISTHNKTVDDLNRFASLTTDSLVRNLIIISDRRVQDHLKHAEALAPLVGAKIISARTAGGRPVKY